MRNLNNLTAEELIEYLYKADHTKEEIKEICHAWLVQHIMDEWMCE